MADFEAILKKALASRGHPNGEERRKIYERARTALIGQLKSLEPPLPPEEISRQRLDLERAIRKVEAGAAAGAPVAPVVPPASVPEPAAPKPAMPAPAALPPAVEAAAPDEPEPVEPGLDEDRPETGAPVLPQPPRLPRADEVPFASEPAAARSAEPAKPAEAKPAAATRPASSPAEPKPLTAPSRPASKALPKTDDGTKPRLGLLVFLATLFVLLGGLAYGYSQGVFDSMIAAVTGGSTETAGTETAAAPETQTPTGETDPDKVGDRLLPDGGGVERAPEPETPAAPAAPPAPAAETTPSPAQPPAAAEPAPIAVGQAAILYEEGATPSDQGFRVTGNVVWSVEGEGQASVIVGTVSVPNRGLELTMRISLNTDTTLPASHLIEYQFATSPDFAGQGIQSVVGLIAKEQEQSRGEALRGAIAEIGGGLFWHALSSDDGDVAVNVPALRDRQWFDIPILYADRRRAILTFEKGGPGQDAFTRAFAAWGN